MKKFLGVAMIMTTILMAIGCATQTPLTANANFPQDGAKYRILGRVTLEAKATKSGYAKLVEEAKRLYPSCDDVVNIMIDAKGSKGLFGGVTYKNYVMSGIAIDYVDVK